MAHELPYIKELQEHWKRNRNMKVKDLRVKRSTSINDCWKPSNEASKEDLREFHREEMKLRKAHRRAIYS